MRATAVFLLAPGLALVLALGLSGCGSPTEPQPGLVRIEFMIPGVPVAIPKACRAEDLNGDGVSEVAIACPVLAGRDRRVGLWVLSGYDMSLLHDIDPFPGVRLARADNVEVAAAGDANGDRVPDLIVSVSESGGPDGAWRWRLAWVSGSDGSVLRSLPEEGEGRGQVLGMRSIGHMHHDGAGAVAVWPCPMVPNAEGGLAVLSGRTGKALYVVEEIEPGASLAVGVATWLDPSRIVVGLDLEKRVLALERMTGEVAYELRGGCRFFGSSVGLIGDRDGDGGAEVWVGCDRGVHIYSGESHAQLEEVHLETETHSIPFPGLIGDVDRDGFEDLLYADERERGVLNSQPASLAAVRSHDGKRLLAEIPYDSLMASNAPIFLGDLEGNNHFELALPTSRSVYVVELR